MGKYVAEQTVKLMIANGLQVKDAHVIVLGMTFKENCPDLRNSKVIDIIRELKTYGVNVHVHDPLASSEESVHEYGVPLESWESLPQAQAIVAAVAHKAYGEMGLKQLTAKLVPGGVFTDVKSVYKTDDLKALGFHAWRL